MTQFVLGRLARAAATIFLVIGFAFVVLRLSGDPALEIMSTEATPEALAAFREAWGLDQPIWFQFYKYIGAALTGDLGQSMRDGRDALAVVVERLPITLMITIPALILHVAVGIPAGVYAALHRNKALDRCVMIGAVIGFTVPSFVLGLLLVLIFAVWLNVLPSGGAHNWTSFILPVLTLGASGIALLARYTRSAMVEVLGQPYIRTASAKGVPWKQVVFSHALPNAAIPTVTIVGFMVGQLIAGAVIVENVFSWPGAGRLLVASVISRDLPVVQCFLFLVAVTMIASNFAVDVIYKFLDPRIK